MPYYAMFTKDNLANDYPVFKINSKSLKTFMHRMGYECININSIEDKIRIDKNYSPNILTGCFKKIK